MGHLPQAEPTGGGGGRGARLGEDGREAAPHTTPVHRTTQNGQGEPAASRNHELVPARARVPAAPGPAMSNLAADSGQPNTNKALTEMLPRK